VKRWFVVLLVFGAAACAPAATEVLVSVTSDLPVPGALDALRIDAWGDGSPTHLIRGYDLTRPENALPLSLALLPSADTGSVLHVVVTGTRMGATVDLEARQTSFVHNQTRRLDVRLVGPAVTDGGVDARDADAIDGVGGDGGTEGGALKRNGVTCAASGECTSGHCVDGVCCDSACAGACHSCALPSAPGACIPVSSGTADPRGVCVAQSQSTCGRDGLCDGAGACRLYEAGTVCAPEQCAGQAYTPPSTCDGAGRCGPAVAATCPSTDVCRAGGCAPLPTLTTSGAVQTPLRGAMTSAPTEQDLCPSGSVLVGFDFSVQQAVVDGARGHCAVPRVANDGVTIELDAGEALPWEGPDDAGNTPSFCPNNQVVVGFRTRHGLLLDQVAVRCAPLTIDAAKVVSVGMRTTLASAGGDGGGFDPVTDCSAGMVASGVTSHSDDFLDGFGLTCTTIVAQ
jgi:hypothetical protein